MEELTESDNVAAGLIAVLAYVGAPPHASRRQRILAAERSVFERFNTPHTAVVWEARDALRFHT